jgi:ribonucleotide reductase alpha subunit
MLSLIKNVGSISNSLVRNYHSHSPRIISSFKLNDSFLEKKREEGRKNPPFGYNGLGEFVYRRTYARENEEWSDTVNRVVSGTMRMYEPYLSRASGYQKADQGFLQDLGQEMFESIHAIRFLPPGRGLWAMGSPITEERRLYAALNNCGFVTTDFMKHNPVEPFTFLMDASMLGVGVGFDTLGAGQITIVDKNHSLGNFTYIIPDSREGWVEALGLLLRHYFVPGNHHPKFNYSLIRPMGEPIKGFGGVSGGPEPLRHALEEIDKLLDASRGKLLTVSNIVDIMNIIGKCIVSGNVRRTAEIAFGDPNSAEFLDLKDYSKNPHRQDFGWTSNNSIMATMGMDYRPVVDRIFKNGEPGLMWLDNMRNYSRMMDPPDYKDKRAKGSNPCVTGDTIVLTGEGPMRADALLGKPFYAMVNGKSYISEDGMFITGYKPVYELKTKEGFNIHLTGDHKVLTVTKITPEKKEKKWVEALQLRPGDFVALNKARFMQGWQGEGIDDEGWLLGYLIGDGHLHGLSKTGTISFTGETKYFLRDVALSKIKKVADSNENGENSRICIVENDESIAITSTLLWDLCFKFGIGHEKKISKEVCTSTSSAFQKAFLSGIFDAIGIVDHVCDTYAYLQLLASSERYLQVIQTMLSNIGINSRINKLSQTQYVLTVDSDNLHFFATNVGFLNQTKNKFFITLLEKYERIPTKDQFIATVESVRFVRNDFVYDCTVEDIHAFSANGIIVHNCLEQTLESYELCCLVETFPERHQNLKEFLRTLELAFFYAKVVTLGQTHWPQTNKVMGRNRRIGTSMSGITQFIASRGMDTLKHWCIEGYNCVRVFDQILSSQLGVPQSVKKTSIKPSGTVSLLAGATPGMHYPISKHYIRRVRLPSNSPLLLPLQKAGYLIEDAKDGMKGSTKVVEFPISVSDDAIPKLEDVSIWQQLSLAAFLQEYWADNSVSCTITFDPEKTTREEIATALDFYQYKLKGISFLPHIKAGAYPQMPYEPIDEETYRDRMRALQPIEWDSKSKEFVEVKEQTFCDNDSCEIK